MEEVNKCNGSIAHHARPPSEKDGEWKHADLEEEDNLQARCWKVRPLQKQVFTFFKVDGVNTKDLV